MLIKRAILREIAGGALNAPATREARLAFWINTYNTLVADGIRDLGLRESVWEVPNLFQRIACRVGEWEFTADEIEHGVLRGNRPSPLSLAVPFPPGDPRGACAIVPLDPRIHFAISCGARSCPPVRSYDGERLDEQLEAAARAFVNRDVALQGEALVVSEIFRWFRVDFDDAVGGLDGFLARHLDDGPARRLILTRGSSTMVYRPYDWRLQVKPWTAQG